jgi:hypothetical protein
MSASIVLGGLAILFAMLSGITAASMANELRARGMAANPLFVRWMVFKYVSDYRRVTLEETGQVGSLYNTHITLFAIAAIFAVATIITLAI